MKLNNKAYDGLKFVALVLLPGFSAAYFSLAQILGLPNVEQVVGTATVLDTFLGLLLKASSTVYTADEKAQSNTTDGVLVVSQDPVDGEQYLHLNVDRATIESLATREVIKLTVATQVIPSEEK